MTARGLDRYMSEKVNGGLRINLGQDLTRIYMILRTIYIEYMALLNECCNYFEIPNRKLLDKFDSIL